MDLRGSLWLVVACGIWAQSAAAQEAQGAFGAQSGETSVAQAQAWLVPSGDAAVPSRALLYRPAGDGPFPLALIAHASTQNPLRRVQMPAPDYAALARFLVARGFAVLVPQRPGHGATGGPYLEDQGGCADADYAGAGQATAESIVAALAAMREQSFVQKSGAVVIGHSAGGFGALALAARHLPAIAAIIAFAPGRGGHADDRPGEVCAPDRLLAAITGFGRGANVPVLWLVAENDSYFPPALSRQLAEAFRRGGAKVAFQVLPPFGSEGHRLAEQDGGDGLYGEVLEKALRQSISPTSPRARREGGERSSPGEGASPRAQTR